MAEVEATSSASLEGPVFRTTADANASAVTLIFNNDNVFCSNELLALEGGGGGGRGRSSVLISSK
jgi:hypothetical protein